MKKIITVLTLCAMLVVFCLSADAQQPTKIPRIGYVSSAGDPNSPSPDIEAFRRRLRELGYIEGKNILIEYRQLQGNPDIYPKLVAELVRLNVDVLVLIGSLPTIRAAKQATETIPIVIVTTQDPVATGLVENLARPGGNITGVTTLQRDLSGKRLELLKEAFPGISRVAALLNASQLGKEPGQANDFQWYEAPARALNLQLQPLAVRGLNPDLQAAFQAAAKGYANALITIAGSLLNRYTRRIADLAIKNRLPSMHERGFYVEAGGLMSYSSDIESFRRAVFMWIKS
jgi:putative ABC transport system substrate-binding protein